MFSFCHLIFCHFFPWWVADDSGSPESDLLVFPKIAENDLWAAAHPVACDRGPSEAAPLSAGHPLSF